MSPIAVGFAAPFRWLGKAFDVGRRNPKALFGAIALMLAVVFAISLLQGLVQALGQASGMGMAITMAVTTVASWLLLPPLFGGIFRVVDAGEHGKPAIASDVFKLFGEKPAYRRMVMVNLVYSLAYLALLALGLLTSLGQFLRGYFTIIMTTPLGAEPDQAALLALVQATPPTALLWMPLFALVMAAWFHASMLSQVTAALRTASVAECVASGLLALARNLVPLLAMAAVVMVGGFVALFLVALVLGLVVGLLSLLSPVLGMLVMLPLMLALMLALYALMFGFYYHGWREIFGETGDAPPAAPGELAA